MSEQKTAVAKVAELTGADLDYWVARANGWELENYAWWVIQRNDKGGSLCYAQCGQGIWKPSTDWAQGGPIIEREKICVDPHDGVWDAKMPKRHWIAGAPSPLVAAMRAFVESKFGYEVPDHAA
jgi:hypothetical protein